MRRAAVGLLFASVFAELVPSAAWAQVYSVASGLVLEARPNPTQSCPGTGACCGGVQLAVSPGTYWLGNPRPAYAFTDAQSLALAPAWTLGATINNAGVTACGLPLSPPLLDVGGVPANSKAYYCYMYETTAQGVICSATSPYPNGQPGAVAGLGGYGTNAVFIGSFLTDSHGVFVPMHRVGEQVLLSPLTQLSVTTSVGYSFNGGIAYCVWPSPPGSCSGPTANSVGPYYPATASAGIFDVHVISANADNLGPGGPSLVQFLDPHPYQQMTASSIQAQISIGGETMLGTAGVMPEVETVRLTLNANQIPTPYAPNDSPFTTNPLGGLLLAPIPQGITVVAVLRGYIESPQRLFSR